MDRETQKLFEQFNDEFIKFKREIQDTLENLDFDNFSGSIKQYISKSVKSSAGFEASADTDKAWARMFAEYKSGVSNSIAEIKTLADANNALVSAMTAVRINSESIIEAPSYEDIESSGDKNSVYVVRDWYADDSGDEIVGKLVGEKYYYYNEYSGKWEQFDGDSIYTVFEQTPEGFKLKGNTIIDGDTVITRNLKLSGNVTWDMSNSPVLSQYTDDVNFGIWHSEFTESDKFMQMSFDGGNTWSNPIKVVGDDGADGIDGSSASMTDYDIFLMLTNGEGTQGFFPFYSPEGTNKLYINAEYINSELSVVKDKLFLGNYIEFSEDYIEANEMSKMLAFNTGAFIGVLADNSDLLKMFSMYIQLAASFITLGYSGTTGISIGTTGSPNIKIGNLDSATTACGDWDFSGCSSVTGIPLYFG